MTTYQYIDIDRNLLFLRRNIAEWRLGVKSEFAPIYGGRLANVERRGAVTAQYRDRGWFKKDGWFVRAPKLENKGILAFFEDTNPVWLQPL